jgi:hypothetical protein
MSLIVYGIIQAPGWGWASAATLSVLAAGVVVLAALVAAERAAATSRSPWPASEWLPLC